MLGACSASAWRSGDPRLAEGEGTSARVLQEREALLTGAAAFVLFPKCPRALLEFPRKVLEERCDGMSSCPGWGEGDRNN